MKAIFKLSNSVVIQGLYSWSFTLLFVAFKLSGQIDWNWILVLSPLIARVLWIQILVFMATKRSKQVSNEQQQQPMQSGNEMIVPGGTYL